MMAETTHSHRTWLRFRDDADAAVSVEFVLVLPLLMLWFVLSLLFFDAYRTASLTEKVAFTISDIMSRHDAVDDTDVNFLIALNTKMLPQRLDRRAIRITSICFEDDTYKVMWSVASSGSGVTGWGPLEDEAIPLDIMPAMSPQDSIILTEVNGRWTPLSDIGGLQAQTLENALVTRPRFVRIVPHTVLNSSTLCPRNVDDGTGGSGGGVGGDDD